MILFILTREGYDDMRPLVAASQVWTNLGLLTDAEIDHLRTTGVDLTDFTFWIDPGDMKEIQSALNTIALHHPGQRIWVETKPTLN
jgi:hypothetical protein